MVSWRMRWVPRPTARRLRETRSLPTLGSFAENNPSAPCGALSPQALYPTGIADNRDFDAEGASDGHELNEQICCAARKVTPEAGRRSYLGKQHLKLGPTFSADHPRGCPAPVVRVGSGNIARRCSAAHGDCR